MRRAVLFAIPLLALAVPAAARGARANPADDLTHIPIEASVYDPGAAGKTSFGRHTG
jgi:hypothetical protein